MAGYRRFIAYVYEYRKGKKGENCGFIKVEVREERCAIEVHLHCEGITPQTECKIFGFVRKDGLINGILLGSCDTQEDIVECLIETDSMNMAESGVALGKMGGMIFLTESGGFLGTEWDDQPIRPDIFKELSASELPGKQEQVPRFEEDNENKEDPSFDKKEESDIYRRNSENQEGSGSEEKEIENKKGNDEKQDQRYAVSENKDPDSRYAEYGSDHVEDGSEEKPMEVAEVVEKETDEEHVKSEITEEYTEPGNLLSSDSQIKLINGMREENSISPEAGIQAYNIEENNNLSSSGPLGQKRNPAQFRRLPFGEEFMPFDDGEFLRSWKIRPEDLRYFPMRNRSLHNNRFLQHGYYNFGHILLAHKPGGQFILGVPGGYDQQERFMANMFGFPWFKASREIELPRNKGGYWYRLIDAPNLN